MICGNCKQNEATTHIKRIVNGETMEYDLCGDCARELGYTDVFSSFSPFNLSDFFSDFIGEGAHRRLGDKARRCPKCGSTFNDIIRENKLGCAECYRTFADRLAPSIERIHGKSGHCGKRLEIVASGTSEPTREEKIDILRSRLAAAIKNEEYEQAAALRDEIKALEVSRDEQ